MTDLPLEGQPKIRVLVVDDHPAMRDGLRHYIDSEPDMTVAGEATDGKSAVEEFLRLRPDVTLMDLQMQIAGGLQAISAIRSHAAHAVIVVLTTYPGEARTRRALALGATSYLLKSSSADAIVGAIRASFVGQRVLTDELAAGLKQSLPMEQLSPRELDVMRWIAEGATNLQIAETLHVSEQTVKTHVKSILAKLGAHDRTHAVAIARRRGYIDP
ncbi:response regulator transcription factor [Dyella koreensis]|uniref:response regulator transcription factor n=1 Tax=Dyella koreensis TaxID=311235 RepID=UPI0036208216